MAYATRSSISARTPSAPVGGGGEDGAREGDWSIYRILVIPSRRSSVRTWGESKIFGMSIAWLASSGWHPRYVENSESSLKSANKRSGDAGSRNDRGDFTWSELRAKVKEFLGRPAD